MKITQSNVGKLVCPAGKAEMAFADDEIRGLSLRARDSGARAWYFRFRDANGKSRRLLIGDAKAIKPDEARELCRKAIIEVASGVNPVAERKAARKATTCQELFEMYLTYAETALRPSSYDANKRNLIKYSEPFHKEPISNVNRAAVRAFKEKLVATAGPVQTNRVLSSLSACWVWALRNGVIAEGDNPATYIDKFPEKSRERVLTMEELKTIWKATEAGAPYHRLVRLLMLTGVRRGEAAGMCWAELSGALWTIPAARMKSRAPHEVTLPKLALEQLPKRTKHEFIFGTDAPFSGFSGGLARLRKSVGFSDWHPHDFRRTFSTEMNARGLADHQIIEEIIAHVGVKTGVSGVYNRASYRSQKKAALEAWVKLLDSEGVFWSNDGSP